MMTNYPTQGVGGWMDDIGGILGGGSDGGGILDSVIGSVGETVWGVLTPDTPGTSDNPASHQESPAGTPKGNGSGMGIGVVLLAGAALFLLSKKK